MWRKCPQYMKRNKSAKEPGEFNKKNAHQGKLWGSSKECQLTGRQASLILEKCYEAGCTYAQLKKVKSSLSYAYFLTTGKLALNYKEVWDMWATLGDFEPPTTSIKPTRIPTPEDLKTAWTTPWHKDCGMSLVKWTVAMLIAHDWAIAGARSKEDLKRIKNSIDHEVNTKEGYGSTGFVDGRSKLCGRKRNQRPWRVWRRCLCKGKHKPVPAIFKHRFDKEGNPTEDPTWTTTCPVAAMELVMLLQPENPKMYKKWNTSKRRGGQFGENNEGKCTDLANKWFRCQGVGGAEPYSSNGGRNSLARWLSEVEAKYHEGFEIHGDLHEVWSTNYQPDCDNAAGFRRRTQSSHPDHCLVAYNKLKKFMGLKVDKPNLDASQSLMLLISKEMGCEKAAMKILKEKL